VKQIKNLVETDKKLKKKKIISNFSYKELHVGRVSREWDLISCFHMVIKKIPNISIIDLLMNFNNKKLQIVFHMDVTKSIMQTITQTNHF